MYFFQATTPPDNDSFDGKSLLTEIKKILESNTLPGEISSTMIQVDNLAHSVLKSFGQGREMIVGIKESMTNAYESVALLGGNLQSIKDVQIGVAGALNRSFVLASESYEKLYAINQVTNVATDTMVGNFKDAGASAYQAVSEMQKIVDTARAIGADVQGVSSTVVTNLEKLNKYTFEGGVQGLAKMAAQASILRVDMGSVFQAVDKAFNPESAIEMAAGLQRLGVAQSQLLDPLRLMDLAQNDPAELQNQIIQMSKQFVQLNKDGKFEIMPGAKRQLMEIEGQLGMSTGTLAKMALNSADLGAKLEQIKFPEFLSEDQKTFFANLAEKDTDGIYKITIDDKKVGLSEALEKYGTSPEKLKELQEATRPKDIVDLAKEQLSTAKDILGVIRSFQGVTGRAAAGSKSGQNFMEAFRSGFKMIRENAPKGTTTKGMRQYMGEIVDAVGKIMQDYDKGKITSTQREELLLSTGFNMVKNLSDNFTKLSGNVEKGVSEQFSKKKLFEMFNVQKAEDFVVTPNGIIETHEQDTIIGMTKGEELFNGLGNNNNNNNKTTTNTTTSSTIDVNLNHTVTINAPAGVDTQQLVLALKNDEIKQSIVQSILRGMTNDGRTASNSNPQQRMNSFMNLA
jgi:hypothetical protein